MGLFSFFQTDDQRRATEVRTGARAPSRTERQKCWDSRDVYFACLDRADVLDALKEDKKARKACPAETARFEADCAVEWVKHFKRWRVADFQKRQRLQELERQGGVQMDVTTQFADRKEGTSLGDIQEKIAARRK